MGDFNGDGTSDFLWRNQNGTLVDWTMNGSEITSSQGVTFAGSPAAPDSSWNVAGIGDFNGDGKYDVLWRNSNGSLFDWTMNGSQVTAAQQVTLGGSAAMPDSSWSVAGIGDFNGDGKSDVLWRNTNGSLVDWTMNGSQIASVQPVTLGGSAATPDSSWSIAGIGDFNGDGKADVLWRNTNGSLIDWTMNGSQITTVQQVTFQGSPVSLDPSWQIAQIGDFNGNGASDILLRNTNGAMEEWNMNGAQIASASQVTFQGTRQRRPIAGHAFKTDRFLLLKRGPPNSLCNKPWPHDLPLKSRPVCCYLSPTLGLQHRITHADPPVIPAPRGSACCGPRLTTSARHYLAHVGLISGLCKGRASACNHHETK